MLVFDVGVDDRGLSLTLAPDVADIVTTARVFFLIPLATRARDRVTAVRTRQLGRKSDQLGVNSSLIASRRGNCQGKVGRLGEVDCERASSGVVAVFFLLLTHGRKPHSCRAWFACSWCLKAGSWQMTLAVSREAVSLDLAPAGGPSRNAIEKVVKTS